MNGMNEIVIWGRANSVNVQKVLWACEELAIPYLRKEAGGAFGVVDEPEYRALNPNGRIPTIEDGDFVLWESNAILRYLALKADSGTAIYPDEIRDRVRVERWLDWSLASLQPAERAMFWGMVRTPPEKRDLKEIEASRDASARCWTILDAHLEGREFVEAGRFTLADLVLGAYVHRWYAIPGIERPEFANLAGWYERLKTREPYQRHVALPLT
jgi:glutathione S-transferase